MLRSPLCHRGAATFAVPLLSLLAAGCHSSLENTVNPPPHGHDDMSGNAGSGGTGGGGGSMPDLMSAGDFATLPSTLTLVPLSTNLAFGQKQLFTANRPVNWSVVEAGGGQIASNGVYTAPSLAGIFHVHAVASDGSPDQVFATVNVSQHALTFIAGNFGGSGTVDGVGTGARFSSARGMAWDGSRYLYIADSGAVRRLDSTTNEISTVAGKPLWWTGNVDGVGAAAKFGAAIAAVALDGQGGLYVADSNNETIRKIDLASRKVTTVAGTAGSAGYANLKGTSAQFSLPSGLAFDSAKNRLYIGDANNGAVRVYDPTTTQVSTLNKQLAKPYGLAYDGNGTLYVVDIGAYAVFAVDTTAGTAKPLAGSVRGFRDGVGQQGHFDSPSQATIEGGALYVADTLAVRKIDPASGAVTSVPLRGGDAREMQGVLGDGHGHLFVAVQSDFAIRRVDLAGGADSIVAGPDGLGSGNVDGVGQAAQFFQPGYVTADGAGAVYVSDYHNGEVRKVDLSTAQVSTLVGSAWWVPDIDGQGRQANVLPTSIATDHAGTLFIVESSSNTIRKWDSTTNAVTTLAGRAGFPGILDGTGSAARFDNPVAACADGGALYVADQLNSTIRKIDIASGAVTTIAGAGETSGLSDGAGAAARFGGPAGVACDGAGHVFVADRLGYAIRRIDLANQNQVDTPVGTLGSSGYVDMPGSAARFTQLGEMVYANGFLYVVDFAGGGTGTRVRKIKAAPAWDVSTIATSTRTLSGITVDGAGKIYVSDGSFADSGVFRVNGDGTLTEIAGSSAAGNGLIIDGTGAAANFAQAGGMTCDGSALYVSDVGAARRIDLGNFMVTSPVGFVAATPNVAGTGQKAMLGLPMGVALIDAGTLLVADSTTLDSVTLPGASLTVSVGKVGYGGGKDGNGIAASVWPAGMVSDGAGTIYFTGANTVRRYVPATGAVDTLAGQEGVNGSTDGSKTQALFYQPRGITLDGAGGNLYVSDTRNHTIRKVVIATGDVTTLAGTAGAAGAVDDTGTAARFFQPVGIVHDGKGALYVADSLNGAIRKIDVASRKVTTWAGVLGEQGLQPGGLPAHLNTPAGLTLLPDGGLAVTDEQAVVVLH